jgi:hypothetical protein
MWVSNRDCVVGGIVNPWPPISDDHWQLICRAGNNETGGSSRSHRTLCTEYALSQFTSLRYSLTLVLLMWRIGWAPNSIPIYIQQDATLHSLFISVNCSTCFGWYFHCVKLHLVRYILEYTYSAGTHKLCLLIILANGRWDLTRRLKG